MFPLGQLSAQRRSGELGVATQARWLAHKRAAATIRQMRARQRAERHKCACCKRAAASLARFSLWPSPWQAMRRRSGLPSLRGSRISGGACVSIVFRAAAAENAQLHHEADKLCHFRLAIANRRKNVAYHILLLHVVVGSWLHINIHGYFDQIPKMATRSNIRGYLPPTWIPLPQNRWLLPRIARIDGCYLE